MSENKKVNFDRFISDAKLEFEKIDSPSKTSAKIARENYEKQRVMSARTAELLRGKSVGI